jgi:hypothetical protein
MVKPAQLLRHLFLKRAWRFLCCHRLKVTLPFFLFLPMIFGSVVVQTQTQAPLPLPSESLTLTKSGFQAHEQIKARLENVQEPSVETVVVGSEGAEEKVEVKKEVVGQNTELTVIPPPSLKPGKYTLKVTTSSGALFTQDFTWGVLAINPNKSIYSPQENARLAMAVLDEQGRMVCDAKLQLKVKSSKLEVVEELSTENGAIRVNPECQVHDVTLKPDYEAHYQVGEAGIYEMELSAETKNGVYTIKDFFEVRNFIPFDVERVTATRIYPPKPYPATFNITVNQDFEGVVGETIPDGFEVKSQNCCEARISSSAPSLKVIEWEVSWKAGEVHQLGYEFKAPNVSPQFYLLGPLRFKSKIQSPNNQISPSDQISKNDIVFQEMRQWQIAADDVNVIRPDGDGTPLQWTSTGANHYGEINEVVTQPSAPNTSTNVNNGGSATNVDTFNMGTISNVSSVSQVVVWVYHASTAKNSVMSVDMIAGGTTYNGTVSSSSTANTYLWASATFSSLNLSQADLDGLQIQISGDSGGRTYTVAALYADVTYTPTPSGITLSGTAYSDEGVSPYLCSTSGNLTIQLRVNGGGTYNATCAADDGRWTISGISAASGNTVVAYLDGGSVRGSLVFVTDNTSISDYTLPIYQNRVILRDDVNGSITNGEIHSGQPTDAENDDLYDSTATTYTTAAVTYETHIYGGDTFAPGGDVSTGKLHIPATSTYSGSSEILTLSGSGATTDRPLYVDSGTFTAPTTTTFTGTAASDIEAATYNNLQFLPSSGTPTYTLNSGTLTTANNTTLTIGDATYHVTVTAATNNPTLNVGGNLSLGASSSFTKGSGTLTFNGSTGPYTWTDNNSTKSDMGAVAINGTSLTINLSSSVTATSVNVALSQAFGLGSSGYTLTMTGSGTAGSRPFIVSGTLNEGTNSTVVYTGTAATDIQAETYYHLEIKPGANSVTHTLPAGTVTASGNFVAGNGTNTGVIVAANTNATVLTVSGDFTISANTTFQANASNNLTIGGSWANSGTFTHNSNTVVFNASTTGKTIDSGGTTAGKVFNSIQFNSSTGGWTIQTNNLTTAGNFTVTDTAASGLTVNSVTVEVQGTYSVADAETANTTWTSATLYLNSASAYTVGSKTQTAETYSTLQIGANTDIRIWNSSATTYTVDSSGSLYSQDHAGVDGDLYVWGDYHVSTNDYWSYATDFDGTALGGSSRQVDVRIDPAAVVTVDSGDTLAAIGAADLNRSTVSRQGASNGYQITVSSGGTIDFQYSDFDYLDGSNGLDIQASSTVTSLDYTKFDNLVGTAGTSDAFITVASSVIGAGTKTITGVQFDNTGSGAEFNVNRTGTDDSGYWDFDVSTGAFDGETYDGSSGSNEADPGMLRWDDSTINQSPSLPSNLGPVSYIDDSSWTNDNTPTFNFDLSDPDAGQQVKFQIQIDDTSGFSSVVVDYTSALGAQGTFNFTVGQAAGGGTYSTGSEGQTLADSSVAGGYYWRVKAIDASSAESAYEEAGADGVLDFSVDATAPTGGTVYDGTELLVDKDFNDGSLSQLSASWDNFDATTSDLSRYDYSIGTTAGGTDIKNWTDIGLNISVTATGLTLQTSQVYYFNVRAVDFAGNVQSGVSSDGQLVTPSLTFSVSPSSITFDNLNAGNSYTSTRAATLTTSTNAYNGYVIRAYATDNPRSVDGNSTITDFNGGTYASPDGWLAGDLGFGYTSSDTSVQGSNIFNSDPCPGGNGSSCYAPFSQTAPGDIIADHTATVSGSPISNEAFTVTYRTVVGSTQAAGTYTTTIIYTITPQY